MRGWGKSLMAAAFLVSWRATWQEQVVCPPPEDSIDPYTGTALPSLVTDAVYRVCYGPVQTTIRSARFAYVDEAMKFKDGCGDKNDQDVGRGSVVCSDWKVEKIGELDDLEDIGGPEEK